LAEFGINIPQGINPALEKARAIVDGEAPGVPSDALRIVERLSQQALDIHAQVGEIERDVIAWQRKSDVATRLMTIPGIGPIGATALAASVIDPSQFRSGRQFAARLGLTPLQKSSGGKEASVRATCRNRPYIHLLQKSTKRPEIGPSTGGLNSPFGVAC
jgi:transposase